MTTQKSTRVLPTGVGPSGKQLGTATQGSRVRFLGDAENLRWETHPPKPGVRPESDPDVVGAKLR